MTHDLRDEIAIKAMSAIIMEPMWTQSTYAAPYYILEGDVIDDENYSDRIARSAYKVADAMLRARKCTTG